MKYARAGNVHTWALNLNDICPGFAFSIASKSLVLNVSVVLHVPITDAHTLDGAGAEIGKPEAKFHGKTDARSGVEPRRHLC